MDGIDGVICGMDNESVARAIVYLARDREKQKNIIDYLRCHDYGNEAEVEKIYKLVGVKWAKFERIDKEDLREIHNRILSSIHEFCE